MFTKTSQRIKRSCTARMPALNWCGFELEPLSIVKTLSRYGDKLKFFQIYGLRMRAIAAARGKFVIMSDSDDTYDFTQIGEFVRKLDERYDLVMAMPFLHRLTLKTKTHRDAAAGRSAIRSTRGYFPGASEA